MVSAAARQRRNAADRIAGTVCCGGEGLIAASKWRGFGAHPSSRLLSPPRPPIPFISRYVSPPLVWRLHVYLCWAPSPSGAPEGNLRCTRDSLRRTTTARRYTHTLPVLAHVGNSRVRERTYCARDSIQGLHCRAIEIMTAAWAAPHCCLQLFSMIGPPAINGPRVELVHDRASVNTYCGGTASWLFSTASIGFRSRWVMFRCSWKPWRWSTCRLM
jgi:hypothetical protein